MHKVKKKVKSGKIPKPIKIKKEKTEEDRGLHPMSHYIDDRLELVKQIFGSLKPKTITNLAPDFLKKKSMDDIEELCLNELLGISTKRLLSIINATKCPTDTESSGESDVEHQEEHISLEEISSDSEIEGSSGKKRSGVTKGKTGAKKTTKNSTENDENNGQISVLELLELQARARAIRSQLALEPVTKIEVDSDGEKNDGKSREEKSTNGTDSKEQKLKRRHESSERAKEVEKPRTSSTSQSRPPTSVRPSKTTTNSTADAYAKPKGKEVYLRSTKEDKLKRNYRTKIPELDMSSSKTSRSIFERLDNPPIEVKKELIKEVKKEPRSHSPTPDVIPIVSEPETLLITDSSDGENAGTGKKKIRKMESAKNKNDGTKKDATKNEQEKPSRDRKTTEKDGAQREADKAERVKAIKERKVTERDTTQREADKSEKERPTSERKKAEKDGTQREAEKESSTRARKTIEKDGTQKEAEKAETERSTRERKITEKSGTQGETNKHETEKSTRERKITEKSREQREASKAEIEKSTRERKKPEKGTEEKDTSKTEKDKEKEKSKRERRSTNGSGELIERQKENRKENVENKSETNGNNKISATKNAPTRAEEQTTERSIKTEINTSGVTQSRPLADTPASPTEETTTKSSPLTTSTKPATQPSNAAPALEDEDDRNDDVISLGGDLEKEMIEHLEEDAKPKTSSFATSTKNSKNAKEENDSDIISLDSSESEVERDKESSESWHQRYLKSSKVSKVLAESRLGKRVRDNIKMSKRSQKDAERVKGSEDKEKSKTSYTSKHEDGSIEQYRELMAMRQRKRQQKKST